MWWLWSTSEEEGGDSSSRGRSRASTSGSHQSRCRGPQSRSSSVLSSSSGISGSRPSRKGHPRTPSRQTRGRPHFPSTFSVHSRGSQSGRTPQSALTENTTSPPSKLSPRSRASSESSTSRQSSSRPQRNIRIPRSQRRRGSSSQSARSLSSLEDDSETETTGTIASQLERIHDSFFGALQDITDQIQMTIAENEYYESSHRDDDDDNTIPYDNTGRISLHSAPRSSSLAHSRGNATQSSAWTGSSSTQDDLLVFGRAIWALRVAILAQAMNAQVLGPNYPLLVEPVAHHEDSFPSTELRLWSDI